jgi:hypothetical protein
MSADKDWQDVAERAMKEFEKSDLDLDHLDIQNPGNMLLFYFFQLSDVTWHSLTNHPHLQEC